NFVKCFLNAAGAMSGKDNVRQVSNGVFFCKGFFRKYVSRHLDSARTCDVRQRFKIDNRSPAHQYEKAARPDKAKLPLSQKALVFGRHACKHKYRVRGGKHFFQDGRYAVVQQDLSIRQPWVEDFNRATERTDHWAKSARQISKTNDAYPAAGEKKGILVALKSILLGPVAESAIVFAYPAGKVQRKRQSHFGHRDSKCGTGN